MKVDYAMEKLRDLCYAKGSENFDLYVTGPKQGHEIGLRVVKVELDRNWYTVNML